MRTVENEKVPGSEIYFGRGILAHTLVIHIRYDWDSQTIPDGETIPTNYAVVRFYKEGEPVGKPFLQRDGNEYEMYHTHDPNATSWQGDIQVGIRLVEKK